MEVVIGIALGIGLSAACGFRIFIPLLIASIAAKAGMVELADGFAWVGSWPALICFAVATAVEIAAYYIPWLDNLLDTIATPAATIAGILVAASFISDMGPLLKWTLAVIAGGGTAGVIKFGMAKARLLSSLTTGGLANPIVSTIEAGGSFALSGLAIALPIAAAVVVVLVVTVVIWRIVKFFRGPAPTE